MKPYYDRNQNWIRPMGVFLILIIAPFIIQEVGGPVPTWVRWLPLVALVMVGIGVIFTKTLSSYIIRTLIISLGLAFTIFFILRGLGWLN